MNSSDCFVWCSLLESNKKSWKKQDLLASDQWPSSFHEKISMFEENIIHLEVSRKCSKGEEWQNRPGSQICWVRLLYWNTTIQSYLWCEVRFFSCYQLKEKNLKCLPSIFSLEINNSKNSAPLPPKKTLWPAGQQCQKSRLKDDVRMEDHPQSMRQTEMMLIQ